MGSGVSSLASASHRKHKGGHGHTGGGKKRWGGQAVLVLVGVRLGLDNVNPLYYDNIKVSTIRT